MQFYFEIEKLAENVLIYPSLGSGLGKCSSKLVENVLI
jgi:hypothetical protein